MPKFDASKVEKMVAERDRRIEVAKGLVAAQSQVAELVRREWSIIDVLNRNINSQTGTGTGPGPDSMEDEPGDYRNTRHYTPESY